MEKLKSVIHNIVTRKSTIEWLIIHEISKLSPVIDDVEFSFVDGKERQDEPFKTNQGYICLNSPATIDGFEKIITNLIHEFKNNPVVLANLFIITSRASYTGEDKEPLSNIFEKTIGKEACQTVFNLLINSLNSEYYKYSHSSRIKPVSTKDWLDLFLSAQYLRGISDPLMSCLRLVKNERNHRLDFEVIAKMKPILRSALMGWYGYDLNISSETIRLLHGQEDELTFLSACLIDDFSSDKTPPQWLSEALIELFIDKHWSKIGKHVFVYVFGLSYRNKNQNELFQKLEDLIHTVLFRKLSTEKTEAREWIYRLEFPGDFIALFAWLSKKKIEYSKIPTSNKVDIFNQFIKELQRISKSIPIYLAAENGSDPFSSFQLHEIKYQNTMAHLLFLSLYATDANRKELTDICFEFKTLFFGGFEACAIATDFAELMLQIGLAGNTLVGLEENEFTALKKYLNVLADTILIPYIHLAERNDEIWNFESKRKEFQYNAGRYLISAALSNIQNHKISSIYQNFFERINEIKVSKWPYEQS